MKRLFVLLLAIGLVLPAMLSGCHGARKLDTFRVPEEFDDSAEYHITFWAKNDTNKAQTNTYEKAIADFEALYPNIHVEMRLYTDYTKIYNDVITNIATETTPNVCITYPDHIATYKTGTDVVVPLDTLFADKRYGLGGSALRFDSVRMDEIVPQFLAECKIGDSYYALPYMRSTEACYVNKTYVEKLGYTLPETLTWDFIWEVSEAAAKKNEDGTYCINGQKVMIPFIYKSTDNMMIQLLRQYGGGYSEEDGTISVFNDTTRNILETVAKEVKAGAFSTFKISGYPANFLNAGQCIFAIDSTAGATWMGSHAPLSDIPADKFVEFETAVMTVPQADPEHPQMISQGPSVCVFNKRDSGEVLASWLFAQFLLTDSVQIAYAETEGYVPVTTKAQNTEEYQTYLSLAGSDDKTHYSVKIEASRILLEHPGDTFVAPVFNGSTSLRNAAGQMIEKVALSVRRKETVDDGYYAELKDSMISLYRLGEWEESGSDREMGPLPTPAVLLLAALCAAWLGIGAYCGAQALKKRKK